jgi:hypothetical protein
VLALKPQLVIVNNGATKGWQNSAWETTYKIPGLEDVWQLHQAMGPNRDHNVMPAQVSITGTGVSSSSMRLPTSSKRKWVTGSAPETTPGRI